MTEVYNRLNVGGIDEGITYEVHPVNMAYLFYRGRAYECDKCVEDGIAIFHLKPDCPDFEVNDMEIAFGSTEPHPIAMKWVYQNEKIVNRQMFPVTNGDVFGMTATHATHPQPLMDEVPRKR